MLMKKLVTDVFASRGIFYPTNSLSVNKYSKVTEFPRVRVSMIIDGFTLILMRNGNSNLFAIFMKLPMFLKSM